MSGCDIWDVDKSVCSHVGRANMHGKHPVRVHEVTTIHLNFKARIRVGISAILGTYGTVGMI